MHQTFGVHTVQMDDFEGDSYIDPSLRPRDLLPDRAVMVIVISPPVKFADDAEICVLAADALGFPVVLKLAHWHDQVRLKLLVLV